MVTEPAHVAGNDDGRRSDGATWQRTTCSAETGEIAAFYDQLVRRFGRDPRALDWRSRASQLKRFEILAEVGELAGCRVLDVGCGLGDLHDFLAAKQISTDYAGWDIAPAMVEAAKRRLPHAEIRLMDIAATHIEPSRFDFVIASGLFSLRTMQPYAYVAETVRRMLELCRRAVAFNSLSARWASTNATVEDGRFVADPARTLDICLELTPNVVLRHDYMPHDFTIYLYK
ncbi:class I SAM-dependent methyltransferase [soil metagenome]